MSKEKPNKQKNIDDVLLSIDSLLDTASDIEFNDTKESLDNSAATTTSSGHSSGSAITPEKPLKPKPRAKTPTKPKQKKTLQAGKTPQSGNKSTTRAKTDDPGTATTDKLTTTTKATDQPDKPPGNESRTVIETDQPADTTQDNNIEDDPSSSLIFTTVDDDLSHAMRELPVLDDIVTIEDLALIGSGKEPPKKILTEAFKRLSLTDKLIEILENQLTDYNISKLEYKYLHELFDELLEKENKKK